MSYQIDPHDPSQEFLRARNAAGVRLQEQFKRFGGRVEPQHDYRWLKADLTWPSFDHLTFAYRNQVFSVLVDLVQDRRTGLKHQDVKRCVDACTEHNLVPCVFPVDSRSFRPLKDGWNLSNIESGASVVPDDSVDDVKVEMSEWESHNFAIQIVRDDVEKSMKGTILSYCDVIGIDPQIWFDDQKGNRCWVIVRNFARIDGTESTKFKGIETSNPQLVPYDGYFAAVSVASSEPFTVDLDAKLVPLSKRFDGSSPIYRGDGFYVNFKGLERIYVG
ncbi:MAG: hypothetical protein ACOYOF_12985 [Verrucomicrobiaceae bacterium]|jgi:hypothetical protein